MNEAPVIELRDVSRAFGPGNNQTLALRGVSLKITRGEFVAIIGPSGSGKSTLLNTLGLLDRPSSGSYLLNGTDVSTLSERERDWMRNEHLGFVFQDSRMLLGETSVGNAALPLKVRGASYGERRARVGTALNQVGLGHRLAEKTINLSGGERQRVAIARAISTEPALILADEPTGSLDSENSQRVIEHLRDLNSNGATVVIITHDPTVAAAARRQITLVDGAVRADKSDATKLVTPHIPPARPMRRGRLARRIWDELLDALSSHSSKPGRAMLLLLAFMLGTGGLVCSIGISQSAAAQVAERLTEASLDEVVVRFADPMAYGQGFYFPSSQPTAAIAQLTGVRGTGFVASVAPAEARITLLPAGSVPLQPSFSGSVLVSDSGYLNILQAKTTPEHAIEMLDTSWKGKVAIIGSKAAGDLGIGTSGPGVQLWVAGIPVDVVGIFTHTGRDSTLDNSVVLSASAAAGLSPENPSLVVRTVPGYPAALAEAIPLAISPSSPSSVSIETVADLRSLRIGVATDLSALIATVSVLLLLLACLSSAVAMYLSVQARAPEIALRRAVGSSRSSIWRIFTMEGLIIGAAGGLAGGTLGLCAVIAVSLAQGWTPTIEASALTVGLIAGCLSGIVSATYPAIVAARSNPALAIRG